MQNLEHPEAKRKPAPLVPVATGLERRLAFDLLAVLEAEVPDADAGLIGLTIAAEAGRRAGQDGRSWGDRPGDAA